MYTGKYLFPSVSGFCPRYGFYRIPEEKNAVGTYQTRKTGRTVKTVMMNYSEARQYLTEVTKYGSVPGLDSIRELMRRLGNPQDKLKFIHIAGTNGKGSVLAYLSTILKK